MRFARLGATVAACAIALLAPACGPTCFQGNCPRTAGDAERTTASGDDQVCIKDAETGTHIVEVRCYKRSELDERRASDRAILDRAQMGSNRPAHLRDQ